MSVESGSLVPWECGVFGHHWRRIWSGRSSVRRCLHTCIGRCVECIVWYTRALILVTLRTSVDLDAEVFVTSLVAEVYICIHFVVGRYSVEYDLVECFARVNVVVEPCLVRVLLRTAFSCPVSVAVAALCGLCWQFVRQGSCEVVQFGQVDVRVCLDVGGRMCVEWMRCVVWCVVTSWGVVPARNEVYCSAILGLPEGLRKDRFWTSVVSRNSQRWPCSRSFVMYESIDSSGCGLNRYRLILESQKFELEDTCLAR